jgi:hypothetical protein
VLAGTGVRLVKSEKLTVLTVRAALAQACYLAAIDKTVNRADFLKLARWRLSAKIPDLNFVDALASRGGKMRPRKNGRRRRRFWFAIANRKVTLDIDMIPAVTTRGAVARAEPAVPPSGLPRSEPQCSKEGERSRCQASLTNCFLFSPRSCWSESLGLGRFGRKMFFRNHLMGGRCLNSV